MIRLLGAAFTTAADGEQRSDAHRRSASRRLGIPDEWATGTQVHGATVAITERPGPTGDADGIVTMVPGIPLAVRTADCAGVVLHGDGSVGVAHAGWRGAAAGIVGAVAEKMASLGAPAEEAVIGPHIGPCCFEVGPEVVEAFPGAAARTSWDTPSVDLAAAIDSQLGGVPLRRTGGCTRCGAGWLSHRADETPARLAAIGWVR